MIPEVEDYTDKFIIKKIPDETYHMKRKDFLITGKCNGMEAIKQSIFKRLNTERYKYPIYSWDFGIQTKDLIGKEKRTVIPLLKQRIRDELEKDDRIEEVTEIMVTEERDQVHFTIIVETVEGEVREEVVYFV